MSLTAEEICLRYRDRASKRLRLSPQEFLRRFLLHVLPARFKRIRHYGLTANRSKVTQLAACRAALHAPAPPPLNTESPEAFLIRLTACDVRQCPHCSLGQFVIIRYLPRPTRLPDLRGLLDRLCPHDPPSSLESLLTVVAQHAAWENPRPCSFEPDPAVCHPV